MRNSPPPKGIGDYVRIRHTPVTAAAGIVGLEGTVRGVSVPSSSGVEFIGSAPDDFVIHVDIEEREEGVWLAPEHVEVLHHNAGLELRLDGSPTKFVRRADGGWDELPA